MDLLSFSYPAVFVLKLKSVSWPRGVPDLGKPDPKAFLAAAMLALGIVAIMPP